MALDTFMTISSEDWDRIFKKPESDDNQEEKERPRDDEPKPDGS